MRECEGLGEGGTRWMSIVAIKIWAHVGTHEDIPVFV